MIKDITPEKEQEVYAFAIERFNKLKDKRDLYDDRVFDWLRLYNSIPSIERNGQVIEDWQHNMFVPYIFATVETIAPRIKASIFNDQRYISIDAQTPADAKHEKNLTDWYLYKLDQLDFEEKMTFDIKDALIYPCAWEKVLLKKNDDGEVIKVDCQRVDYYDIWTDFAYKKKPTDLFHRIESNMNKLRALEEKGIYKNVEHKSKPNSAGDYAKGSDGFYPTDIPDEKSMIESLFMSISDYGIDEKSERAEARRLNKVELIEWWGSYDIDDDGYDENIVVTIKNRCKGIRIDTYKDGIPYFPIRVGKNTRIIYGRPLPQQLEMLQEELNEQRSKRYDIIDRLLTYMFKARRTATIDWDNLFSAPDNVLLMDDIHNDLETMEQRPLPSSAYQEETITKNDMEFVSGARDYGQIGTKGTATGINAILSESATRFRSLVDDVVTDMLALIEYIFLMIKKYSTEELSIRTFDSQEWKSISKKALEGDYKIKVGVSNITTPNKELRIQLFINLLNILGRMQGMVNIKEFVKMILKYADIRNPDEVLGETGEDKKKQNISKAIAKKRKAEEQEEIVEPGSEGVTNRILEAPEVTPLELPSPVSAQAPQTVKNPLMELLMSTQGGAVPNV